MDQEIGRTTLSSSPSHPIRGGQESIIRCEQLVIDAMGRLHNVEEALLEAIRFLHAATLQFSGETSFQNFLPRRQQTPYEAIILKVLRDAGQRLTFAPLRAAIAATGHQPDDSTIKRYIKKLMLDGQIDNRSDVQPPGYGLASEPQVPAEPQPAPTEKQAGRDREEIDFGVAILLLLKKTGHRRDFPALRDGLAKMGFSVGDVTLKRHLASLIEQKKIDHRPEAHPPGYGIIESD